MIIGSESVNTINTGLQNHQAIKQLILAIAMLIGFALPTATLAQPNTPCGSQWGEQPDKAKEAALLYSEFFKQQNYKGALPYLKTLWQLAPGAYPNIYIHGITIYKDLLSKTQDEQLRKAYIDTIFQLYDGRIRCFDQGYAHRAYDLSVYRPSDIQGNLAAFDLAFAKEGNNVEDALLLPYMMVAEKAWLKRMITIENLLERYMQVVALVESKAGRPEAFRYNGALAKISERTALILNCSTVIPILQKQYEANPNDLVNIESIFKQLGLLRCATEPLYVELADKIMAQDPSEEVYRALFFNLMAAGKYADALEYCNKALELATDNARKAEYHLHIAKLQQRNGDFSAARSSALKSAEVKPSGVPYVLIGDLYAASGKICDTGTGFESYAVTWAAIDMYEKAKGIDAAVTAEANKKIAAAKQLLPSSGECYFRELKEGQTYTVNCWINATTTVRCIKE